jgi:hypothetical protein
MGALRVPKRSGAGWVGGVALVVLVASGVAWIGGSFGVAEPTAETATLLLSQASLSAGSCQVDCAGGGHFSSAASNSQQCCGHCQNQCGGLCTLQVNGGPFEFCSPNPQAGLASP